MQYVPHLHPVAVNRDWLTIKRGIEEVREPSLVFIAELPWASYTQHAEDHRRQTVDSAIIAYILVCRAFGAPVGRMKIQGCAFVHSQEPGITRSIVRSVDRYLDRSQRAIDLVCRRE